jgi:hypothetical protein
MYILSNNINILIPSHQIDICQLPTPDACGVKHRQAPPLVRAAPPELAR